MAHSWQANFQLTPCLSRGESKDVLPGLGHGRSLGINRQVRGSCPGPIRFEIRTSWFTLKNPFFATSCTLRLSQTRVRSSYPRSRGKPATRNCSVLAPVPSLHAGARKCKRDSPGLRPSCYIYRVETIERASNLPLARRLGDTVHVSPLLHKVCRMSGCHEGRVGEWLLKCAVARGASHYERDFLRTFLPTIQN